MLEIFNLSQSFCSHCLDYRSPFQVNYELSLVINKVMNVLRESSFKMVTSAISHAIIV